mmetsp:Transcript_21329/g.33009  ORF Transcript_21329/g.33009 Transcript_21329/m.33009 type:complete len:123 (+) Transcript_21329:1077-1445(+)
MPMFLAFLFEMVVSMRRLQEYLESEEGDSSKFIDHTAEDLNPDKALQISKSSFSWGIKRKPKDEEDDDEKKKKADEKKKADNQSKKKSKKTEKLVEERADSITEISSLKEPLTTREDAQSEK